MSRQHRIWLRNAIEAIVMTLVSIGLAMIILTMNAAEGVVDGVAKALRRYW